MSVQTCPPPQSEAPDPKSLAAHHIAAAARAIMADRWAEAEFHRSEAGSALPEDPLFETLPSARSLGVAMSVSSLRQGDYETGWALSRALYRAAPRDLWTDQEGNVLKTFRGPQWSGDLSEVSGKRLLVVCYEGFGDIIQWCRFLPALTAAGAELTVACMPGLWPLMRSLGINLELAHLQYFDQEPPPHDLWMLVGEYLPALFDVRDDTIPTPEGYLRAAPDRLAHWRQILPAGPKVGLVWGGDQCNPWDLLRSIPPQFVDALHPLLGIPGATFVSLQVGPRSGEVTQLPGVFDASPLLTDYGETAALIANLDLVITVETSVAHLAGAMGCPVWVMLATGTCWRWMEGRSDSPWYRSARLFRQRDPGDWDAVVADVATALRAMIGDNGTSSTAPSGLATTDLDRLGRAADEFLYMASALKLGHWPVALWEAVHGWGA